MDDPTNELLAPEESPIDSWKILLSLYLVLLTFFLLLVSISSFDAEKRKKVTESVLEAFALDALITTQKSEDKKALQQHFEHYRALFSETLALPAIDATVQGETLRLRLPVATLFPDRATEADAASPWLTQLATALKTTKPAMEITFLIGYTPEDQQYLSRPAATEVAQAGSLSRQLVELGVSATRLTAGLSPENPGFVDIFFTPVGGAP